MTIKKTLMSIILAGALILGVGCRPKEEVQTSERVYRGFYNGFRVRINDKKEIHQTNTSTIPKFSMICRLDYDNNSAQDPNNPFQMIYGEDYGLDGEWDFVRHLPKGTNGYYNLHPRDIIYAKKMLDGAVEAVGVPENQVDNK